MNDVTKVVLIGSAVAVGTFAVAAAAFAARSAPKRSLPSPRPRKEWRPGWFVFAYNDGGYVKSYERADSAESAQAQARQENALSIKENERGGNGWLYVARMVRTREELDAIASTVDQVLYDSSPVGRALTARIATGGGTR
jgi:hypothetical protein